MPVLVAVDIGGTFTDIAAYDVDAQRFVIAKALTTYDDYIDSFDQSAKSSGVDLADCAVFKHGTTLIINALIQRRGAATALITTSGFRDVLEIGRGNRADPFNLRYRRDEPLISRDLRFEVDERIDGQGKVVTPLDEAGLRSLADSIVARGIETVAVSFLNSYRNPEHEEQAVMCLRRWYPDLFVTCGSDLSREWYEYERTATAAANAFVGPTAARYIAKLEHDLKARGYANKLRLMSSSGGALSPRQAVKAPIDLVESGPVGGLVGAAAYAHALDLDRVIAFDMGGTTAKAAMLLGGRFDVNTVYYVGGYANGFPVRSNIVDIVEVGAGGGSIARIDDVGRLHVGPQSAGSEPGPVAFGRGGTEPTVTDANIVLGRIDPNGELAGDLALNADAALESIRSNIAEPLGYSGEEGEMRAAAGILELANVEMANAIRRVTTERGHDPRKCTLLVYGGGGPMHAVDLARQLHIPSIIVPRHPSNFSAFGMLMADVQQETVRTFVDIVNEDALTRTNRVFTAMAEELSDALRLDFGVEATAEIRHAEIRYFGQQHTVRIELPQGSTVESVRAAFDEAYRVRHGHADSISAIEFVGLRLTLSAREIQPVLASPDMSAGAVAASRQRSVYQPGHGRIDVSTVERDTLPVGHQGVGPLLIEEYGTTTFIGVDDTFKIGPVGEIRITVAAPQTVAGSASEQTFSRVPA
ncbi:MAG: hydantoinase/oxoprolinase family protein [Alphaproteobacteria bacterium]